MKIDGHILVVDDSAEQLQLLTETLAKHGHRVRPADSGYLALAAITHEKPELILMDVSMPGLSGLDVCARLHTSPQWQDIPVLLVSGRSELSERVQGFRSGAVDFIVKPYDKEELLARVNTHLELARLRRNLTQQADLLRASTQQLEAEILERQQVQERLMLFSRAVEQSPASVVITNTAGDIEYVNEKFTRLTGYTSAEVLGKNPRVLKSGHTQPEEYQQMWATLTRGEAWSGEFQNKTKAGELYWELATITQIKGENGEVTHYLAVKEDITARRLAEQERAALQLQLNQAQKLESIGLLAAGIAHEINTPAQFVSDNIAYVTKAAGTLDKLLAAQPALVAALQASNPPPEMAALLETLAKIKLPHLRSEIPAALEDARDGMARITKIVRAMKNFSHPGGETLNPTDLNQAIDSTVIVCRNEWKYVAELTTDFSPELPLVPCLVGEFNQVILILVVNAAHAIADVVEKKTGSKGQITVSTRVVDTWAEIRVQDTGTGIPESARSRIFTPFFTTKQVGKGTGQGLALARSVICERHRGTLHFETETGCGTTFVIRLPLVSEPAST